LAALGDVATTLGSGATSAPLTTSEAIMFRFRDNEPSNNVTLLKIDGIAFRKGIIGRIVQHGY
jgi:hypothetical protein